MVECLNNAAELLKERTSDAAGTALELLTKALSISLYSEKLLQMKAEALVLVFSIPVLCSTLPLIFIIIVYCFTLYIIADNTCRLFMVTSCSCKNMTQQFSFVNRVSISQKRILPWQTAQTISIFPRVIVTHL